MDKILAPIKQRLLKIADLKEVSRKVFFEKLKVSPSNFRSKSLFSEVSGDVLAKISSIYTDLNSEWLLTGEGEMLKQTTNKAIDKEKHIDKEKYIVLLEENRQLASTNIKLQKEVFRLLEEKEKTTTSYSLAAEPDELKEYTTKNN